MLVPDKRSSTNFKTEPVLLIKGILNLKSHFVVCPVPSSLVLVTSSNIFLLPSLILAL